MICNFQIFFHLKGKLSSLGICHAAFVSFLMTFEDLYPSIDLRHILILLSFPLLEKHDYICHKRYAKETLCLL